MSLVFRRKRDRVGYRLAAGFYDVYTGSSRRASVRRYIMYAKIIRWLQLRVTPISNIERAGEKRELNISNVISSTYTYD